MELFIFKDVMKRYSTFKITEYLYKSLYIISSCIFCILICNKPINASTNEHVVFSSLNTRPIGLGGAYTSVVGTDISAVYNPALSAFYSTGKSGRFSLLLTPIETISAIKYKNDLSIDDSFKGWDWLNILGVFTKSFSYSNAGLKTVLILTEQLPNNPFADNNKKVMNSGGLLNWNYSTLSTTLQLAKQISIGISGFVVTADSLSEHRRSFGTSYGVAIRPDEKLTVGVAYFDFNNSVADIFLTQHRFVDETINVGISFSPTNSWLFSADVKNVSDEEKEIISELHTGAEFSPWSSLAVRVGYFKEEKKNNVYSFGLSLLRGDLFEQSIKTIYLRQFFINYGLQIKDVHNTLNYSHFLSMTIRI